MNAQNLTVSNGVLKFSTVQIYEQYASNQLDREDITNATNGINTMIKTNATLDETVYPEFLQTILNPDKIFALGDWLIKIDLDNNTALVINEGIPNAYNHLVNNNANNADVIVFTRDTEDALDVLSAITNNEITINDYKNASPEARIRWPWQKCAGAGREVAKGIEPWNSQFDPHSNCVGQTKNYAMDNKAVYQKAIFYFSLQAKTKSLSDCSSTNWTFSPTYQANLKINGTVKYVSLSNCREEINESKNELITNDILFWRAYEGSRSLHKYELRVRFGIKHTWSTDPYTLSNEYVIEYGY